MIAFRPVGSSWQKTTCSWPDTWAKTPEGALLVTVVTLPFGPARGGAGGLSDAHGGGAGVVPSLLRTVSNRDFTHDSLGNGQVKQLGGVASDSNGSLS